jgi:hypothetical protein
VFLEWRQKSLLEIAVADEKRYAENYEAAFIFASTAASSHHRSLCNVQSSLFTPQKSAA